MPLRFDQDTAILEDFCTVEEADSLLAWFMEHPGGAIDLQHCKHLHAAILQVILSCKPKIIALPEEEGELRAWMITLQSTLEAKD